MQIISCAIQLMSITSTNELIFHLAFVGLLSTSSKIYRLNLQENFTKYVNLDKTPRKISSSYSIHPRVHPDQKNFKTILQHCKTGHFFLQFGSYLWKCEHIFTTMLPVMTSLDNEVSIKFRKLCSRSSSSSSIPILFNRFVVRPKYHTTR